MAKQMIPDKKIQICKELLATNKYTQKEIAEMLEIGAATVSDIKNNKHKSQLKTPEKECTDDWKKELIPSTEVERWFDLISEVKMIGIHLNTSTQQYDEIIDLLIRQNALLAELVELWKPDTSKAC